MIGLMMCGASFAQSQVTIYGLLDEGLLVNTNSGGKHLVALQSGVMQGNRWGLLGKEDLGGGVSVVFRLENGFDLSSGALGQGGREFGRQAYVGLSNGFGTITMGRHFDPIGDYVGPFGVGVGGSASIAAHPGDIDQFLSQYRINNSVKFVSKPVAGLSYAALYSVGGVAGDFSRNQIWALGAGYLNGPVALGVAYFNSRNPNIGLAGGGANVSTSVSAATSYFASPVVSGFSSAHTYQIATGGGAYTFGAATIDVTYSNVRFMGLNDLSSGPNAAGYRGTAVLQNAEINLKYSVTPAFVVIGAYNYTWGSSVSTAAGSEPGAKYNQVSLSGDYFLSKRTDVYVTGVFQRASGTDSRDKPAVASLAGLTPSTNNRQLALRFGMRTKF
ncbi:porin [Burkholderia multivorans]|uniref:porin n=1 Tax=Burkholderia multivorans TaxID=87883 RepID=UPI001C23FB39|nr:porin [Burkholderia multivorans]MBU9477049.1 porin [Burkholderia multivorans]